MENKVFTKVLLVIYCLIVLIFAVVILFSAWGIISTNAFNDFIQSINPVAGLTVITIVGLLMVVLSFVFMFGKGGSISECALIKESTFGSIFITITALEEIAKRYFNEVREVRAIRLQAFRGKTGIRILILMSLAPQVVIPAATDKIQTELKACLEDFTGIVVDKVDLRVCDSTLSSR